MKTIEVTDEMYEFLMNLSKELNTQDHRGTRMPYFFQVMTKKQVCAPEGSGIEAWHCDGSLIETDEEIRNAVNELKDWDENSKEYDLLQEWEIQEILEDNGWYKIYYEYADELENAFLTEKACIEHIRINRHNLNSPDTYLSHAFRNPELEMVLKFLCELTGGKLHT